MGRMINKKSVLRYLYDQLTGNFAGFLIGMSATSLVSHFFEKRSIKNLWGLTAKKAVVNKETFSQLEWVISIIIGFIVFEIVTKFLKERIDHYFPIYKQKAFRLLVTHDVKGRVHNFSAQLNERGVVLFQALGHSVKRVFKR